MSIMKQIYDEVMSDPGMLATYQQTRGLPDKDANVILEYLVGIAAERLYARGDFPKSV